MRQIVSTALFSSILLYNFCNFFDKWTKKNTDCLCFSAVTSRESSFLIREVAAVGLQPVSSITFETQKIHFFLKLS